VLQTIYTCLYYTNIWL